MANLEQRRFMRTIDRIGCDVQRRNLYHALNRISERDLNEVRSLLGTRDPAAGAELRRAMQRTRDTFNNIQKSCTSRSDKCCALLVRTARDVYDEADYLRSLVERQAGEERMRAGMFGDLGRYSRKARSRARRKPTCRYVWVRSHYRS